MISVDTMVEVTLKQPDDFLKVKETLTRIGVASKKSNTLFQSCHILHKQGKYYIYLEWPILKPVVKLQKYAFSNNPYQVILLHRIDP